MSDETDHEHTHRVVGKAHRRTTESDSRPGSAAVYEPGEPITPTARELESLPRRFERIVDEAAETTQADEADTAAESDTDDEPTETTDEPTNDDTADEGGESDTLTPEAVKAADYNDLRGMATEYDDISGNWGADRLRAELLDRVSD